MRLSELEDGTIFRCPPARTRYRKNRTRPDGDVECTSYTRTSDAGYVRNAERVLYGHLEVVVVNDKKKRVSYS